MDLWCSCVLLAALSASDAPAQAGAMSLLDDLTFAGGFDLTAQRSSARPLEIGHIMAVPGAGEAKWRLAQWGSRYSLIEAELKVEDDGTRVQEDQTKRVAILPGGLAGEGLILGVKGGEEYEMQLRADGQPWAHLLLEQKLTPGLFARKFRELPLHVEFKVLECVARVTEGLNPNLHTAHVAVFLTIHNDNPESPDYKDMLWFGIPVFDARVGIPRGHQAMDTGQPEATNKFICTIEGSRFYDEPIVPGQWRTLECDVVPLLQEAIEAAHAHGFLTQTTYEDLSLSAFNVGWEVPGPYDCAIQLRHVRFEGVAAQE